MFKIIETDNFARDYNGGKSERLIADNIERENDAKTMADAMNARYSSPNGSFWAKVVTKETELYVFEGY